MKRGGNPDVDGPLATRASPCSGVASLAEAERANGDRRAGPDQAGARPRYGGEEVLLAIALGVLVAIVLLARHFPYQDAPNHLARYVLISRAWAGEATPGVEVYFAPGPYFAIDVLGVALVRAVGAKAAGKVLALTGILAVPCGMYLLLRAVSWARRGWALVGVLLALSWFLLAGMINYTIGLGGALAWLALWWNARTARAARVRLALAAGMAALYLVHLVAPLVALLVVWVDTLLASIPVLSAAWRRPAARRAAALRTVVWELVRRPAFVTALLVSGVAAVLWLWTWRVQAGIPVPPMEAVFRSPGNKLLALGAPIYSFSVVQAGIQAAAYVAALVAFVRANPAAMRLDTFTLSTGLLLALFVVFPKDGAVSGLDIRWPLPALLLVFCVTTPTRARPQRAWLLVAFAGCLAHAGVVTAYVRDFDARLDEYDVVLGRVPRGARLLSAHLDGDLYPRIGPYMQYSLWHVVRGHGEAPGLFSVTPLRDDPPFPHLRHFVVRRRSYTPAPRRDGALPAIAWDSVAADYDYLVLVDPRGRARRAVASHACEVARQGAVTLHRVGCRPPPAASGG